MATICIVGLWHQGSVLSACLADLGHQVRGVGEERSIAALSAGRPPVSEPLLAALIRRNIRRGRLRYTADLGDGLRGAEFVYVAFDTPVGADDEPHAGVIHDAVREIGRHLSRPRLLCVSAQVPVGTCDHLGTILREQNPRAAPEVVCVPEFLRLGSAVESFRRADRFVIGAATPAAARRVAALYKPLGRPIITTDVRTAEMAKHASNAYLAASISFINEIADLCDEAGADVVDVARIMRLDRRIGKDAFLSAGLGFAGGTLGRDVRALQALGRRTGRATAFLDAVIAVNDARAGLVEGRLRRLHGSLRGLRVGVLGLTYKAGTSTLRRSAAVEIIRRLVAGGAAVAAFDPLARLDEGLDLPPFDRCPDPYAAARAADAVVLVTEWAGIRAVNLRRLRAAMKRPVMIDTRNFFDPGEMGRLGFTYFGIGRSGGGVRGRKEHYGA